MGKQGTQSSLVPASKQFGMADKHKGQILLVLTMPVRSTIQRADQLTPGALVEIGFPGVFGGQPAKALPDRKPPGEGP